jgi:ubiquinone/menaquinone biosynthesis C-methylase UbiE
MRVQFDRLSSEWDSRRGPEHLAPLQAALERLPPPRRVLDLGTGTGVGAFALARRYPQSEIVGVDLSAGMVDEARHKLSSELASRVSFDVGDAERLPYENGAFDLVVLLNMIPFFDELARVTAPDGHVVFSFSWGAETPIYVPPGRLQRELGSRGFGDFREVAAGAGTGFVARKGGEA